MLRFIKLYVNFDKPEINAKFDREVDTINNKIRTMGIIEQEKQIAKETGIKIGKQQERTENKQAFVTNLLQQTAFSNKKIADLADVSIDFVLKVKKSLPSA